MHTSLSLVGISTDIITQLGMVLEVDGNCRISSHLSCFGVPGEIITIRSLR